jgi:Glyoxalase-like domain
MVWLASVDHLVWGGADLEQEIGRFEARTGVRPVPAGRHPGEGTRNAIIRLGPARYLELIAPDVTQGSLGRPRWFGLDDVIIPRLISWAVKSSHLDQRVAAARTAGVPLGEVRNGRRQLSSGEVVSWRLTYPDVRLGDGLVPFLIDWGISLHPAQSAPGGVELVDLRAEHPEPESVTELLRRLGVELPVTAGNTAALIATLETPRGRVELR